MRKSPNLPLIIINLALMASGWILTGTGFLLNYVLAGGDQQIIATLAIYTGMIVVLLAAYRIYRATTG